MQDAVRKRVQVVVLGDFGRSPRMQYHALSLATQAGFQVDVVAYAESKPWDAVSKCNKIIMRPIHSAKPNTLPRALSLVLKVIYQVSQLLWMLIFRLRRAEYIVLQTPPCIPTFLVCQLACLLRGTRLIVDWHNFGYSLLAYSLHARHPLLRIATWYERRFARYAHAHMCVTHAMKERLITWGLSPASIHVMHDRPAPWFARATLADTHELLTRISPDLGVLERREVEADGFILDPTWADPISRALGLDLLEPGSTVLTQHSDGAPGPTWRSQRAAMVVSSTSWTPDEDFDILLEAVVRYDELKQAHHPPLLVLVTGKGPQKEMYERRIQALSLRHVIIRTLWLSFHDYATLLGSADLGVCLHTSSSGLDLPMKVLDMFGSGLPVAALRYPTLNELVREGVDGVLFGSSIELCNCLLDLFGDASWSVPDKFSKGGSSNCTRYQVLREGAMQAGKLRWETGWSEISLPIFQ